MNDQQIDDLLDQSIPLADANARKIAINASLNEFSQASAQAARPIGDQDTFVSRHLTKLGSFFMNNLNKPAISNTFATVAVAFVAVSVFLFMPERHDTTIINEPIATKLNSVIKTTDPQALPSQQRDTPAEPEANAQGQSTETLVARTVVKTDDLDTVSRSRQDPASNAMVSPQAMTDAIIRSEQRVKTEQQARPRQSQKVLTAELDYPAIGAPIQTAPVRPQQNRVSSDQMGLAEVDLRTDQKSDDRLGKRKNTQEKSSNLRAPESVGKSVAYSMPVSSMPVSSMPTISEPSPSEPVRPDLQEEYAEYQSNPIKQVSEQPVSTFSIDVDTASYSLLRNQLQRGLLPAPMSVRAEELINYFNYDYPTPASKKQPFETSISVLDSPWNKGKKLVHIGIKGYELDAAELPDSNIVFLLDVSGSMRSANKLPLVKQSIGLLLDTLKPSDTISIAVYAGAAGTVLEPTKVAEKSKILAALQRLSAGGSTAGGAGIELAYQLAEQSFNKNAVNRIILATDGDFNVGLSSNTALQTLVERKRDTGVFLSILGFGRNNYQDDMMQTLAQNGNGVAAYIDTLSEAKKVLVDEATSTLFTIAKDVKLQVEFNPATVSEYRLIGYETRALKREDFNNDKVDAGDIGAGHTVTAIYEITPSGAQSQSIDAPRYAENRPVTTDGDNANEYGFLKIRYKLPKGSKSNLIEHAIARSNQATPSSDVLFSTAVAGFAQLLTGGKHTAELSYKDLIKLANANKGADPFGYRSEFIQLVRMAEIAKP